MLYDLRVWMDCTNTVSLLCSSYCKFIMLNVVINWKWKFNMHIQSLFMFLDGKCIVWRHHCIEIILNFEFCVWLPGSCCLCIICDLLYLFILHDLTLSYNHTNLQSVFLFSLPAGKPSLIPIWSAIAIVLMFAVVSFQCWIYFQYPHMGRATSWNTWSCRNNGYVDHNAADQGQL